MRCFAAVDIDPALAKKISELQENIRMPGVKLVRPDNLHFTIKFFGEISQETANLTIEKLQEICKKYEPFEAELYGVGVFPDVQRPRVVWIGAEKLFTLQSAIFAAFGDNEKPVPHLTIARIKQHTDIRKVSEFILRHKTEVIGAIKVDSVKLKKSTPLQKGPVYTDIAEFELGWQG